MKRTLGLAVVAGAIALALALALTGCGGSDDSDGVASLTDTTGQSTTGDGQGSGNSGDADRDREQAALDYARCMREHGVDMPDPVNGRFEFKNERRDQRKFEEAQQACQDILRDAAPPVDEEQEAEMREAALSFAKCMRQHGVDMPDPTFPEGGGVRMRMPEGTEDDPQFEQAQKACQSILEAPRSDRPSDQEEAS
jgi:hypothetical protein